MKRRRNNKPKLQNPDQTPTTPNSYSFSLTKIAVSQICRSIGYKSTESSTVLNTLTLTTTKYLQSLAELASSFANTANRTEVNVFDIVNALQNLTLATNDYFPGAYNNHNNSLIKSGVLRNVLDFVNNSPEIPFARALPRREIVVDRTPLSTRSPIVGYVPGWLPAFPEVSRCNENCVKERSDQLWGDNDLLECSRSNLESCGSKGRSGGVLPVRRAVVRFKLGRDLSSDGVGNRLERWRDENDGEITVKRKICEELIYSSGIVAEEWPV